MTAVSDEPPNRQTSELRTILLIDGEGAVRAPLASYLRDCGLTVIEVGTIAEATRVLLEGGMNVDLALCDTVTSGTETAFSFSRWMKSHVHIWFRWVAVVAHSVETPCRSTFRFLGGTNNPSAGRNR